jgi:hypothetical protein
LKFYRFGGQVNIDIFNPLESEHVEDLKALGKLDE